MFCKSCAKNYLFQVVKKELYIKVMYVMKSYDENLSLVEMSEKLYLKLYLQIIIFQN